MAMLRGKVVRPGTVSDRNRSAHGGAPTHNNKTIAQEELKNHRPGDMPKPAGMILALIQNPQGFTT
jgi:hypothetical protein